MKLLTEKQKKWLCTRTVKIGSVVPVPGRGFTVSDTQDFKDSRFMKGYPFNGSLFVVKDITDGVCRVNFSGREFKQDLYVPNIDLETRGAFEFLLMLFVCYLPMITYNFITNNGQRKHIPTSTDRL